MLASILNSYLNCVLYSCTDLSTSGRRLFLTVSSDQHLKSWERRHFSLWPVVDRTRSSQGKSETLDSVFPSVLLASMVMLFVIPGK